jgi:hypothetical protein
MPSAPSVGGMYLTNGLFAYNNAFINREMFAMNLSKIRLKSGKIGYRKGVT